MPTYLYGLILTRNAHLVPAHITGLAGSAVRILECETLGAIVSTVGNSPARGIDEVRAHDHALQSIVHHGATAAAGRFGQTFSTDVEARAHVLRHGDRIARVLHDCDGCVEMRVLVRGEKVPPARAGAPEDRPGAGRAYLEGVRADRERVEGLGVRAMLEPFVRAERVEELPKSRGVAFSHLIERRSEAQYRSAIGAIPGFARGTIVGPLALHAFAEPR